MYVYVVLLTKEKRYDLNELILDIAHFKLTTCTYYNIHY